MTDAYPPGTFDSATPGNSTPNDPNRNFNDDHSFSSYGSFDATADDDSGEGYWEPTSDGESGSTNARSRATNAQAADAAQPLDFGRAFPVPGSGGVVGDDDLINHAYGES